MPKMLVPRDLISSHPASEEAYLAVAIVRAQKVGRTVVDDPTELPIRVDHGRWLADCPHCASGISVNPEWLLACCLGCHRVFRSLLIPKDWEGIDDLLDVRPVRLQHLSVGETLKDIEDQNAVIKAASDEPIPDLPPEPIREIR